MQLRTLVFVFLGFIIVAGASAKENTLEHWAKEYHRFDRKAPTLIAVSATLKVHGGKHHLVFCLTNLSKRPIRAFPHELPWGGPSAIRIAAFTTDGKQLRNVYPIDDPPFENPVTIMSGQALRGEYLLAWRVDDIDSPRKRDVVILWSYDMFISLTLNPKSVHDTATCTGAIVIPKT